MLPAHLGITLPPCYYVKNNLCLELGGKRSLVTHYSSPYLDYACSLCYLSKFWGSLHTFGLLRASFRPENEVCALRSLVRQRKRLIEDRVRYIHRMQKALVEMNLHLTTVLSDITGVTGMSIIRHILAGQRNPIILAQFRDARCQRSEADIVKALQGDYRPEHLFALQQSVAFYDFFNQQIALCDQQIEVQFDRLPSQIVHPSIGAKPRRSKRKNDPEFDLRHYLYQWAGVDLTAIDGLDALSVLIILSETGVDMSKWPTVKHL